MRLKSIRRFASYFLEAVRPREATWKVWNFQKITVFISRYERFIDISHVLFLSVKLGWVMLFPFGKLGNPAIETFLHFLFPRIDGYDTASGLSIVAMVSFSILANPTFSLQSQHYISRLVRHPVSFLPPYINYK
jgi:hypothetical protein